MLGNTDDDPSMTFRRRDRYPIDNRDMVIGPLPKAAPPVLGDWSATDPRSDPGLEIIRQAVDGA
jgi:hypothetical protein